MKIIRNITLLSFLIMMCLLLDNSKVQAASPAHPTARDVIEKVSSKLKSASGVNASFTLTTGGRSLKGSLKSQGVKFALTTPSVSSWYNGKSMWTYNAGSKETTVINPTQAELAETNPLLLVSTGVSQFTASFAKTSMKGFYNIVLAPKSKKTGMKSIHVCVNASTFLPSKIVAVPNSGSSISVEISSIKTGVSFPASTFEYSKSTCRNATVVDLR